LAWLSWLSVSFIALLILWFPSNLLGGFWSILLVLGRLLTLYFVGWYGLRQTAVLMPPIGVDVPDKVNLAAATEDGNAFITPPFEPASPADKSSSGDTDSLAAGKYARSGMTEAVSRLIGQRLEAWAVHERGYLDPDIRLTGLAERIGTSPQLLSQYLNDVFGVSFFDYINGLRVAEVQKMMRDRSNDTRTLLDLAFAAGFTSKSTFNTSFKKISGLTPSSWRNQHVNASGPIG
jgi:AraC-like DNA-binding protein